MPSNNNPRRSGGRPRKYYTAAAAVEAKKQRDRQRYLRVRLQAHTPVDFIAFEPQLHANIPAHTPTESLRTSHDVQIPLDPNANAQQDEARPSLRPNLQ